jgi:hypothetical protein
VRAFVVALLSLTACEDQHYVNPQTVRLTISGTTGSSNVVDHCSYVPVLLGSQVETHFDVDADLSATFTVTRSAVTVDFTGAAAGAPQFRAVPKDVDSDVSTVDDDPPAGYTVELRSGCTPDDG